jgi:enamine deaminase RidA (YjgF/YER057c/UK114 family)
MTKRALIPPAFKEMAEKLNMSPGIQSGQHVFLTGVTGSDGSGKMPENPKEQFQNIFDKVAEVLSEGNLTLDAIVEMTSYHVGLRDHFDLFDAVRLQNLTMPYPAWTAVEAAGLRREGAVAEVRIVASVIG